MRFFPAELNDIISSKMTNVQSKEEIVNKIANGKIRKVSPRIFSHPLDRGVSSSRKRRKK
jgi:hypothetical protein